MTVIPRFRIEWAGTPNQTKGRGGHKPIAIVNHLYATLSGARRREMYKRYF